MPTLNPPRSGSLQNTSEQTLIALRRILKVVEAQARTLARETGLTPSQVIVLKELSARDSAQPGELARSADLKQATMSILLDRLQERGLVQRTRGDEDRRTIRVQITQDGRRVLADVPDLLQIEFGSRFMHLPDWEQAYINAALTRLVALLGAGDIDASPVLDVGDLTDLPAELQGRATKT